MNARPRVAPRSWMYVTCSVLALQGRSTTLICTPDTAKLLHEIMDETIEGPAKENVTPSGGPRMGLGWGRASYGEV